MTFLNDHIGSTTRLLAAFLMALTLGSLVACESGLRVVVTARRRDVVNRLRREVVSLGILRAFNIGSAAVHPCTVPRIAADRYSATTVLRTRGEPPCSDIAG